MRLITNLIEVYPNGECAFSCTAFKGDRIIAVAHAAAIDVESAEDAARQRARQRAIEFLGTQGKPLPEQSPAPVRMAQTAIPSAPVSPPPPPAAYGLAQGSAPSVSEIYIPLSIEEMQAESTKLMYELGWGAETGRAFLSQNYDGARGRGQLTPEQYWDFVLKLRELVGQHNGDWDLSINQ